MGAFKKQSKVGVFLNLCSAVEMCSYTPSTFSKFTASEPKTTRIRLQLPFFSYVFPSAFLLEYSLK